MRLSVALGFACGWILAQPAAVGPAFDVASVKRQPADAPRKGVVRQITATGLTLLNVSLGNCIQTAYGYENFRTIGPGWRDRPTDTIYDIVAKTATPVSDSQIKRMLQTLLQERLRLASHRETRDLPVYALVVARSGIRFHRSESDGVESIKPAGMFVTRFERASMARLAQTLDPPFTSRHTVDETGLAGVFDFTLDLAAYLLDPAGGAIHDGRGAVDLENAYIQALPAELGLRLEKKTEPLEVMVIDHVDKDPTAN